MAYWEEDSVLDQINQKQIFLDFYYEDFKGDWRKCIFKAIQYSTTKKNGLFIVYSNDSMHFGLMLWFSIIMLSSSLDALLKLSKTTTIRLRLDDPVPSH